MSRQDVWFTAGRYLAQSTRWLLLGGLLTLLGAPAIVIVAMSFSNDQLIEFPPRTWGVSHYSSILHSPVWRSALHTSLVIGTLTTLLALALGLLFVMGTRRTAIGLGVQSELVILGPIVIPGVAFVVALYALYAQLHILATTAGIVIAHTLLAVPFVVVILGAALSRIPRELEYAAMTLGGGRLRTYREITLRLLTPALLIAAVFAFNASFEEAVFATWLGGPGLSTIPRQILSSIQMGADPSITAIGTLLFGFTIVTILLVAVLRRLGRMTGGA